MDCRQGDGAPEGTGMTEEHPIDRENQTSLFDTWNPTEEVVAGEHDRVTQQARVDAFRKVCEREEVRRLGASLVVHHVHMAGDDSACMRTHNELERAFLTAFRFELRRRGIDLDEREQQRLESIGER